MRDSKEIADEVWSMLPNTTKRYLRNVKKTFKESIAADVDDLIKYKLLCFRIYIEDNQEAFKTQPVEDFAKDFMRGKPKDVSLYCDCGNPSKKGNCHFVDEEKLVYNCADCGKPVET